ncbi:hypothetical protein ACT3UJ_02275 [Halomonas sp. 86]
MSDKACWAIAIGMAITGLAFTGLFSVLVWDECREAGHSGLYCLRMVTR